MQGCNRDATRSEMDSEAQAASHQHPLVHWRVWYCNRGLRKHEHHTPLPVYFFDGNCGGMEEGKLNRKESDKEREGGRAMTSSPTSSRTFTTAFSPILTTWQKIQELTHHTNTCMHR
jgi:hypothetical protein